MKKHEPLQMFNLTIECLTCGKRQTLVQEIIAKNIGGYVPFIEEECKSNEVYISVEMSFHAEEKSVAALENELSIAFNDLMKEFPDGASR